MTVALFLAICLIWTPDVPADNPRFQILPAIWIYLLAGLGAQRVFKAVSARWPTLRPIVCAAAATGALCLRTAEAIRAEAWYSTFRRLTRSQDVRSGRNSKFSADFAESVSFAEENRGLIGARPAPGPPARSAGEEGRAAERQVVPAPLVPCQ